MKVKNNKLLKGSFLLAVGAFLAKLIGALYRIPLTNLLGAEGLGLYQMVFPVYCVLLDFSGAGAPSAISKLVSENDGDGENLLKGSLRLFIIVGLIGSLLMTAVAYPLSVGQGNAKATGGYIFLAPSVFFVSLISCYRGYFQGKMNMTPTAISQVIEQLVKLAFGLILVTALRNEVRKAVAGATLAVSLSELIALIYLVLTYKIKLKSKVKRPFDGLLFKKQLKPLVKYTAIVTLIGIAIPLSQVLDSFLIINILSSYRADATGLYGLYAGTATTVINLPVAICYGVSTVAIPAVSSAKTEVDKIKNAKRALALTFVLSIAFAVACYVFSPLAVRVLFGGISQAEKQITVKLIRLLSLNVVFLSILQTENAVFIGRGKPLYPLVGMGVGIAVKTALNLILLPKSEINIYGGVIAVIACYFTACLVNLLLNRLSNTHLLNELRKKRVKSANQKFDRG